VSQGVRVDAFFDVGPPRRLLHGIEHTFGLHGNVALLMGIFVLGNRQVFGFG
jgi:hypothetical protein